MKNPHKRYSRTITCTDEEWDPIQADANRRGKSASEWFVKCALTEEVTPKQAAPRKLVLDAKAQRSLSRDVAEFARGSHADGDGTSRFADNLHALLLFFGLKRNGFPGLFRSPYAGDSHIGPIFFPGSMRGGRFSCGRFQARTLRMSFQSFAPSGRRRWTFGSCMSRF